MAALDCVDRYIYTTKRRCLRSLRDFQGKASSLRRWTPSARLPWKINWRFSMTAVLQQPVSAPDGANVEGFPHRVGRRPLGQQPPGP